MGNRALTYDQLNKSADTIAQSFVAKGCLARFLDLRSNSIRKDHGLPFPSCPFLPREMPSSNGRVRLMPITRKLTVKGRPIAQKQLLTFFASLWLLILPGTHGVQAYAQPQYRIKAGGFGVDAVTGWSVYIAQEKMFLTREGIQFDFTRTYDQMRALIGGSFDIIVDGISTTSLAAEKGAEIVIVYDLSHRPSEYIALGPNIHTLAELEGKTIGIGRVGTLNHLLLKQSLTKNGVDVSKISFRTTGGSNERFAALYNGQISATLLSTAHAFRAQQEGIQIISLAKELVFPWTYIVLRRQWAETNSEIVIRFLRGLHKATLWLYDPANFQDAVRTLTKVTRFEERTMAWALKSSIENKVYNLEKPDVQMLQLAIDWHVSQRIFAKAFDAKAVIDARYYDAAIK
jgi:ABC-type nitrate/sulfonate/bicarbonate transport system substrate-binding protein